MAIETKPNLSRIWASAASAEHIQDPDVTEFNKFINGWRAELPPYENFNFVWNLLTKALAHINQTGVPHWDNVTTYEAGVWARSTVNQLVYRAKTTTTNNEPSASPTQWELATIKPADALQVANNLSDVNSALTAFNNIKQLATTGSTGVVELATQAEADGNTGGTRVITSDVLNNFAGIPSVVPATTTVQGIVELATQAEVDGNTGGNRVVTSDTLNNYNRGRFVNILPVSVHASSTISDVDIDLRSYLPNGGEAVFSFEYRYIYNNYQDQWASIVANNAIPGAWDRNLHAEMFAHYVDAGSNTAMTAGNLFKVSSTGIFRLHRQFGGGVGAATGLPLYIRLHAYRPW